MGAATAVIIINMIIMAVFLFAVDFIWGILLSEEYGVGILKIKGLLGGGSRGM